MTTIFSLSINISFKAFMILGIGIGISTIVLFCEHASAGAGDCFRTKIQMEKTRSLINGKTPDVPLTKNKSIQII